MPEVKFISVLIPCFNVEKTIQRSLISVLDQEWPVPYEIICINNNSTDETLKEINNWAEKHSIKNIKILNQSLKGIVPTLNFGIFNLSNICDFENHFIARQDGDDVWLPGKIKKQVEAINQRCIDIIGCQMLVLDKETCKPLQITNYPIIEQEIKNNLLNSKNSIPHPGVMYRRSILLKTGLYDDLFPFAEDMWLWVKASKYFKFENINEILVNYYHKHNPEYRNYIPQLIGEISRSLP